MNVRFDIKELLPGLPNAEDACAHRLVGSLEGRAGIRRVHLEEERPARGVCVHYAEEHIKADYRTGGRRSLLSGGLAFTSCAGHALLTLHAATRGLRPLPMPQALVWAAGPVLLVAGLTLTVAGFRQLSPPSTMTGTKAGPLTGTAAYRWSRNPKNVDLKQRTLLNEGIQ